jgi:hypothetical protein
MSRIVQNGVEINRPFIAVQVNYRESRHSYIYGENRLTLAPGLSAWGLLYSDHIAGEGATNLALRDQRLALHWVNENIAALGGNPAKVTIWVCSCYRQQRLLTQD